MMGRMKENIPLDRAMLLRLWDEAWSEGLWAVPWSRVLEELSGPQALWRPQPDRHCIWQYVTHMLFWREVSLRRLRGEEITSDEQKRRNFEPAPREAQADPDELRRLWEQSFREVRAAIADERHSMNRFQYVPFHDSYHVGQIMLLRAMQGMLPIE